MTDFIQKLKQIPRYCPYGESLMDYRDELIAVVEAAKDWLDEAENSVSCVDEGYDWLQACFDRAQECKDALATLIKKVEHD